MEEETPEKMSLVVETLVAFSISFSGIFTSTESVLVPPTSIPITTGFYDDSMLTWIF